MNIKVFDWNHFDLDETNRQLKISLEVHGASCLCCVEGMFTKGISICAACANSNNLKHCSHCNAIAYCSAECQKKDWKKHKLDCAELKKAAEDIRARGEISFATGKQVQPPKPDLVYLSKDATRKNFLVFKFLLL